MQTNQPPVQYVPATLPPERPRRGCGCVGGAILGAIALILLLGVGGAAAAGGLLYSTWSREIETGVASLEAARTRETFETTQIMDRNGEVLWEIFGEGKRTRVPLAQIPPHLVQATIAVEDDTFYENIGLDAPSLFAAVISNLRNPDARPVGGSTITQQLVRHVAFDFEERGAVSYNRKVKEIVLAWMMNRDFTKDEILEMYLNEIYYGNLAYGIEAAARTYFAKPAADLTLGEASLLAGLPQSPVDLDPLTNLEGAKERQWLVLNLMVSEGFIDQAAAEAAYLEPLTFAPQEVSLEAPHFAVYVRQQLEEQYGAEVVANGGLRVTTTLDMEFQRLAERLARQHVSQIAPEHNLTNAALVAMKPGSGEILAMLGSVDYQNEAIDGHVNVTLSPQQPGSSIKPLTYALALSPVDGGDPRWTAADVLWDVPVDYEQVSGEPYVPVNYDGAFHGPVRLRIALANSYNIPAVLLLQDVTVPRLLEFGRALGLSTWTGDSSQYGLSLTLGGGEVTPLELTAAYATLGNGGNKVTPVSILKVERTNGEVLFEYQPAEPQRVVDERVAYLISHILDDDAARRPAMGSPNPMELGFPVAAKTGTTNDFRDNWTMGYTPGLAVGVWTGNSDNSEMVDISGLTGAAPLWGSYMEQVYSNSGLVARLAVNGQQPPADFVRPAGISERPLCALSSATIGSTECVASGDELFLDSTVPPTPMPTVDSPAAFLEKLDPAVWRALAVPLPPAPETAEVVLTPEQLEDQPPAQLFCHFPDATPLDVLPPQAAAQVFLAPPRNPESLKPAHEWAQGNNVAILPTASCTEELLALGLGAGETAVWRITSPKEGDTISGNIPIVGTASFDPAVVEFYKIELGIPSGSEIQWLTLGETHDTPVVNGQLEVLQAEALPPGPYFLRLIVVKDSNYVGEPHQIQIMIE
ncbi:transglycosylase domain-containing protein, partial [Promineifilum sp.]|uniref:transglycosylase domain-containing protein n=1 Tax=Promineifilum sp. TaxID=2664178 RepID=UPI0035B063DE